MEDSINAFITFITFFIFLTMLTILGFLGSTLFFPDSNTESTEDNTFFGLTMEVAEDEVKADASEKEVAVVEDEADTLDGLTEIKESDSKANQLLAENKQYEQLDNMYIEDVEVIMDELVKLKNPTYSDGRTLYLATKVFYEFEDTLSAVFFGGAKYTTEGKEKFKDVVLSTKYSNDLKKEIINESFDGEMPLTKAEKEKIALEEKKQEKLDAIEFAKELEAVKQIGLFLSVIGASLTFAVVSTKIQASKLKVNKDILKNNL